MSPQAEPSGVSEAQTQPHSLPCSARGPDVLRVLWSNPEMYERRLTGCVTPCLS